MKELLETKLTIAEIARLTGMCPSVIGKIKRGKRKPSLSAKMKILKALKERGELSTHS